MADVVRHGTIIIDIKTGKVELNAPDLAGLLSAQKQQADILKQQTDALTALKAAQEQATEAQKVNERQTKNNTAAAVNHAQSLREAGEGAFRVARALALMSASGSDDLQKLIKNVAAAQAGFDLFAGSTKIIENLSRSIGLSQVATAALMTSLTPYLAGVSALAGAYALWTSATQAQAAAEADLRKRINERVRAEQDALGVAQDALRASKERLRGQEFLDKSPQEQIADLQRRRRRAERDLGYAEFANVPRSGVERGATAVEDTARAELEATMNDLRATVRELAREEKELLEEMQRDSLEKFKKFFDGLNGLTADAIGEIMGQRKKMGVVESAVRSFTHQ